MIYDNSSLFNVPSDIYEQWINETTTPKKFFLFCIDRLELLVELSLNEKNCTDADVEHLRNYRLKEIDFYIDKINGVIG